MVLATWGENARAVHSNDRHSAARAYTCKSTRAARLIRALVGRALGRRAYMVAFGARRRWQRRHVPYRGQAVRMSNRSGGLDSRRRRRVNHTS